MSYVFSEFLKKWLEETDLSRKDLIELLQNLNFEEFKGLDNITLSRWENGKTIPPLYKQLYIAKCLGVDLKKFVIVMNSSSLKVTSKLSKVLSILTSTLDHSLLSLSYDRIPDRVYCLIKKQTFDEHSSYFSDFHNNICAMESIFSEIYKLGNKVHYESIILKNQNDQKIGHYCGVRDLSPLKNTSLFKSLSEDELKKGALINVGYFTSSKHFFELLDYAICYYLLTAYKEKQNLYLFVGGNHIYNITKHLLGIEEEKYYPPKSKNSKLGVYLFKIDILKAICNPLLLPSVQKKLACLNQCHLTSCDMCNLKEFKQSTDI